MIDQEKTECECGMMITYEEQEKNHQGCLDELQWPLELAEYEEDD
jgi:hypothetical protein